VHSDNVVEFLPRRFFAASFRFTYLLSSFADGFSIASALFAAEARADAEWQRTVDAAKKEGRVGVFLYQRENIEAARAQGLAVEEFDVFRWKETPGISSGSNGSIALMNQAPYPNATRVFINWLLSREGQVSFQNGYAGAEQSRAGEQTLERDH